MSLAKFLPEHGYSTDPNTTKNVGLCGNKLHLDIFHGSQYSTVLSAETTKVELIFRRQKASHSFRSVHLYVRSLIAVTKLRPSARSIALIDKYDQNNRQRNWTVT